MQRLVLAILLSIGLSTGALASGSDPLPEPKPDGTPHPESIYNQGLALSKDGDFTGAEAAFRKSIALNDRLPEAWNGLGHALKEQRRFKESLAAYDEALRLRPNFPLAMQYLGELYVETGQIDKARDLLRRLRPIDPENANKLEVAIASGTASW